MPQSTPVRLAWRRAGRLPFARVSAPASLRVTATYDAPAIPAIGFALPDAGGLPFTQERAERGARLVERDAVTFAERVS